MSDNKLCRYCGKDVQAERSTKEFCSVACHDDWWSNNRKMGAKMVEAFPCLCSECKEKVTKAVNNSIRSDDTPLTTEG